MFLASSVQIWLIATMLLWSKPALEEPAFCHVTTRHMPEAGIERLRQGSTES